MNTRISRRFRLLSVVAAAALVACGGQDPDQLLASAKSYLDKHDAKAATIELKSALQQRPDFGEARFLLGQTLLDSGDAVSAAVELRKARELGHPDAQVAPLLAQALLMQGQGKAAIEQFKTLELPDPAATAALKTTLAAAHATQGQAAEAEAAVRAALAAVPGHAPALVMQARLAAGQGEFDRALALVEQVLSAAPSEVQAWLLKGDLLFRAKRDPQGGLAAYRQALAVDKQATAAHTAIVLLHLAQGDAEAASRQLGELKALKPADPNTKYLEAQLAFAQGNLASAKELSAQLLKLAPENVDLLQLAGAVELRQRSFVQAEALLQKAMQLAPQRQALRVLLAQTYVRTGQSDKALGMLAPLLDGRHPDPAVLALAGEADLQRGDVDSAQGRFVKAVALNPDDTRSKTALAVTRLSTGESEAGFATLRDIAASDKGVSADMALISAHMSRKQHAEALTAVQALERKLPDQPLPAYMRGMVQLAMSQPDDARQSFEQALARSAAYFPAAARLAEMDLRAGRADHAKQRFESVLKAQPGQLEAMLAMARLRAHQGAKPEEVTQLLTDAVRRHPAEPMPRRLLIEHHLSHKQHPQALAAAQDAVARNPGNGDLLDALGRAQLASGDSSQALATFNKLATLRPDSPLPQVRLADTHMGMKNATAAAQSLKKALAIKPDLLDVQGRLFVLELGAGRPKAALEIARTVKTQRPKDSIGHVLEGEAEAAQKRWDAATAAFRAGFDKAEGTKAAIGYHGMLVKKGDPAAAAKFSGEWLAKHPKDAGFMLFVAESAMARKDYAATETHYRALLALQPDNAMVLNNLAWVLTQTGKGGALAYAEKANELRPDHPAFIDTLALALAAEKQFGRAIELQRKAVALAPDAGMLRLSLARLYIQAGQKAEARSELEQLAKSGDRSADPVEVKKLLESL